MRKLIFAACALAYSMGVFAQGTIVFNNRVAGSVVAHIYGPNSADPYKYQSGNGEEPVDWTGFPLLSGSGNTAQLWVAQGQNQAESSLQPATPTTTFRTGVAAGFFAGVTATVPNVLPDAWAGVTVAVRVWDNQGGTITSWAMAQSANFASGESGLFNITGPIGGVFNTPPNLVGLPSFNIHLIPEPSTLLLLALGAAVLVTSRCRKQPHH